MIVISGALVLVALVLLVLGLTMTELNFVYASIAVSLVSFVFLVIGILQRRGEKPSTAGTPEPDVRSEDRADDTADAEPPAKAVPAPRTAKTGSAGPVPVRMQKSEPDVEDVEDDEEYDDEELLEGGGAVLVVPGRPRYHVDGCRYLSGKTAEEIDVLDAREDGFTACGVCKPDDVLEELYEPVDDQDEELEADDELEDEQLEAEEEEDEEPEPARVPVARARAAKAAPTRATTQPVKGTRAAKTPARKAPGRTPRVQAVPVGVPAKGRAAAKPSRAPAARDARAEAPQGAASARRGRVVVIPDRGRFHLPDCRFVRDADDTEELSRAQASKQGYAACGVCKP